MFVELIESLRCPRAHESSPLIASAVRTEARHIVDGVLGCPVCGAEFPIVGGVTRFDDPAAPTPAERSDAETGMRLAAFLELADARGFAILCGRWGAHAGVIRQLTDAPLVLVNPPPEASADSAAVILVRDVVPLAPGSARAAALDATSFSSSAARAVRTGGRIVGPESLTLPDDVTELVRDERVWVGEKIAVRDAAPRLVPLTRAER